MSHSSYEESKWIMVEDYSFDSLIMAALRKADTGNHARLSAAFPALDAELRARYNAPGGLLPEESERFTTKQPDTDAALPRIFIFINGGSPGFLFGLAMNEDGYALAEAGCSSPNFVRYDMGLLGPTWAGSRKKLEVYAERYPDGYTLVDMVDPDAASAKDRADFEAMLKKTHLLQRAEEAAAEQGG